MTIAHKIATNALLSLSLDRPGCKPLDNILLKENVHDQHRHHDQGHHRAHHAVIGSKLGADLIQKTGNRPCLRTAQEKQLRKQVVVRP